MNIKIYHILFYNLKDFFMNIHSIFFACTLFLSSFSTQSLLGSDHNSEQPSKVIYVENRQDFRNLTNNLKDMAKTETLNNYPIFRDKIRTKEQLTNFNSNDRTVSYHVTIKSNMPIMIDDQLVSSSLARCSWNFKLSEPLFNELKKEQSFCSIS